MDTLHTVGRVWGMVQCLLFKLSALNRSWELGANPLLCRYAQWMTMAQCAKVFIGFPWGRTVVVSRDRGSCPHWPGMDWKNPLRGGKASFILFTYFSSGLVHVTYLFQVRSWVSASEILSPLIGIYSGKTWSALSGEMALCLPPKKTVAKGIESLPWWAACFLGKGHTRMTGLNGGEGWARRRLCSLSRFYKHVEVSYNVGSAKIHVFMEHLIKMDDLHWFAGVPPFWKTSISALH